VKNKRRLKRMAFGTMLLTSMVMLFMMAGNALAATDPVYVHDHITLRGPDGAAIGTPGDCTATTAFSAKETCGACHDGTSQQACGKVLLSYDEIERHSYHAQMSANELVGWAAYNAGATGPTAFLAKFRKSSTPKGKPWVQSVGHFGKW
jgi:hypothetical protein